MSLPSSFRRLTASLAALCPMIALAHPGHDGDHDLTWDFSGEVLHRLTSPYHLAPAVTVGALALGIWWLARAKDGAPAKKIRVTN